MARRFRVARRADRGRAPERGRGLRVALLADDQRVPAGEVPARYGVVERGRGPRGFAVARRAVRAEVGDV